MDAGKRTVNDIFNGNRILEIPFFQRAYVWDEPQWKRLLEDMETVSASQKPYFLGSVILKQQQTTTNYGVGDVRTVIDGQQRLTTLNLFFKVLCLKTGQNSTFERIFRLINNTVALAHNHNDIGAFNRALDLPELVELPGEDNVTRAYNFFRSNLDPEKLNIGNILSKILFVGIDLNADEDEQQIFDTINSLGVKLTTAELLKNYFFGRDEIAFYNEYWKSVFEKDDEAKNYWDIEVLTGRHKRTFIDLLFSSYLQIKVQDKSLGVKTEEKLEFAKIDLLFESYKKFIKDYLGDDKKAVLTEIKAYAEIFRNNIDREILEKELTEGAGIERMNAVMFGLETTTLLPYVLFVLKKVSDESERNRLFARVETYIMRRMVVGAETRGYNQLFADRLIGNEVLNADQFGEYFDSKEDKANFMPGDDELQGGFHRSVLINKQAAGVLYLIESTIRDNSKQSTRLKGMGQYSLEHLMPKKWEAHWPIQGSQEAKTARNRKLLTLGNLAIISEKLNKSLQNAAWKDKKAGKNSKGLEYFSAGIETLQSFLSRSVWDESAIEARADYLFERAREVWKI